VHFIQNPRVLSSIVKLVPKASVGAELYSKLDQIIKMAFNQRRKKIRNSLNQLFDSEVILNCGIDPNARAENLSVDDYITLSKIKR
jgi:Dimethyladenosine transferase (rRNA methylation)